MVVTLFHFPKIIPKCLTSNPLSQIVTSNPRLQPDIHFAVDMFSFKKTELFRSLASNPNLQKSLEIRHFLALIYLSLTANRPSPHGLTRADVRRGTYYQPSLFAETCPRQFLTIEKLSLNGYCVTFLYLNFNASRIAFIISISNSFFEISIDLSIFLFFLSDFHKSFLSLSSKSIL